MQTFSQCVGCAGLGMLIAGSVWVFNINHDNHLCPSELYNFVYGFIIAIWSICGTRFISFCAPYDFLSANHLIHHE
jgi:hypothetical protein